MRSFVKALQKFITAGSALATGFNLAGSIVSFFGLELFTPLSLPFRIYIFATVLIIAQLCILLYNKKGISNGEADRASSGFVRFKSSRSEFSSTDWDTFFSQKMKPGGEILLMGESLYNTFFGQGRKELFTGWLKKGVKIRVLLLSPTRTNLSQFQKVWYGGTGEQKNIVDKIKMTIDTIEDINNSAGENKIKVRYVTRDMPISLNMTNERAIVTQYSCISESDSGPRHNGISYGDKQPTFEIRGSNTDFFKTYRKVFEEMWLNYSTVLQDSDIVQGFWIDKWKSIIDIKKNFGKKNYLSRYSTLFIQPINVQIVADIACMKSI